jgi:hypothetical protein
MVLSVDIFLLSSSISGFLCRCIYSFFSVSTIDCCLWVEVANCKMRQDSPANVWVCICSAKRVRCWKARVLFSPSQMKSPLQHRRDRFNLVRSYICRSRSWSRVHPATDESWGVLLSFPRGPVLQGAGHPQHSAAWPVLQSSRYSQLQVSPRAKPVSRFLVCMVVFSLQVGLDLSPPD